jgi:hypothetical protein
MFTSVLLHGLIRYSRNLAKNVDMNLLDDSIDRYRCINTEEGTRER